VTWPSSVLTATCRESGRKDTRKTSDWSWRGSLVWVLVKRLQIRTVLSQLPDARHRPSGAKLSDTTGPSWPESSSSNCPVCTFQTWMSKLSRLPAHTISPLGSTASVENCNLLVAVKVRKLRYRTRSQARTLPSRDAVNKTLPRFANSQAVTPDVCSVKVIMQKLDVASQTLILPSSAVVITRWPSGEYVNEFMASKCPCCFRTYDSDCHSQTRSWPSFDAPNASHSPVLLIVTKSIPCCEIL